jgi:hypothetical protein
VEKKFKKKFNLFWLSGNLMRKTNNQSENLLQKTEPKFLYFAMPKKHLKNTPSPVNLLRDKRRDSLRVKNCEQ